MWIYYALISAICTAIASVCFKVVLQYNIDPKILTTFQLTAASISLMLYLVTKLKINEWFSSFTPISFSLLVFSGVMTGISFLLYIIALQTGPVAQVFTVTQTSIIYITLLSVVFLGDQLSLLKLLGMAITIIGILIIAQ